MRIYAAAALILAVAVALPGVAQTPAPAKHTPAASARRTAPPPQDTGVKLAENGHCADALPLLKKAFARLTDKEQRKTVGVNLVRCSNELNLTASAVEAMHGLTRDFPGDPEILYLAVHVYSDLSIKASQELMYKAPSSYQVHLLNAEALETQGKWDEAAQEYRAILATNPDLPGMHYRLGRVFLSAPKTPTTMDD